MISSWTRLLSFDLMLQQSWVSRVDVLVLPWASLEMKRAVEGKRHTVDGYVGGGSCGLRVVLRPSKEMPKSWRMEGGWE